MPVYKHNLVTFPDPANRFLFVHIPRTAGRFLVENFKRNDFSIEDNNQWSTQDGVEISHFHRELYEKYLDVEDIPHFAVVRNPIDRFISGSSILVFDHGENVIIDKQFKHAIFNICKDHDIDSWEIGKIVRKKHSTISKFLPEILT